MSIQDWQGANRYKGIHINRGDEHQPKYRSRLVAKEFKTDINPELYAATPPSECLRLMISMLTWQEGEEICMQTSHARTSMRRRSGEDMVARLNLSFHGTRDAAQNWTAMDTGYLTSFGFVTGAASPCSFLRKDRELYVSVHGDDFTVTGPRGRYSGWRTR